MSKFNQIICFSLEALRKKWPPVGEDHLKRLIESCRNDEKDAWDELYERFLGKILATINATLKRYGRGDLIRDPDVFQDINCKVTRKLKLGGTLDKLHNPLALPHLIELTTEHRTIEWLRKQKGKKIVFKREIERSHVPLEKPLTSGENPLRMKDVVKSEERALDNPDLETRQALDDAIGEIDALQEDERLLMRVAFLFYEGLRERDIRRIAGKRGISREEVTREVDGLVVALAEKKLKREEARGRETKLWHKLRKLESGMKDLSLDELNRDKLQRSKEEIQEIEEQLEGLRKENRGPLRPSNKQIARLLCMNAMEARTISGKIFRIRKKLAENLKKG